MRTTVLLIEDEPNIIEAIRFLLSRDGLRVEAHSDGSSAVARALRLRPALVILDMMLPGRSGMEVLADLRARDETRLMPVLMLTARGQSRDRETAERLGANRFMTKPFSNAEMRDVVRGLIEAGAAQ